MPGAAGSRLPGRFPERLDPGTRENADVDLAWISLGALLVTIVLSCVARVNPGIVAIVFAWLIGVYIGPSLGKPMDIKAVAAGFPIDLFLTLLGVTLLFA